MDYISVKEAAKQFHLSERRVQKLCETNRIEGCTMVSGVWLIPSQAQKPSDDRTGNIPGEPDILSLKNLCDELSISTATGRNWIKLGKLTPNYTDEGTPYFTRGYISSLKEDLQTGKNSALKSRRNKKFISGTCLYNSYVSKDCRNVAIIQNLLAIANAENINFTPDVIQYVIADCALHLFAARYNLSFASSNMLLLKYLKGEITIDSYHDLIDALIMNREQGIAFCNAHPQLFESEYMYEPNEDILGLIYISCKNMGSRKATGSYYTPTRVVKELISILDMTENDTILDPCCGTGNFLLQLPENIPFEKIYGNDIDSMSVKITRVNMALKYNHLSVETIIRHITERDYLADYNQTDFQYIIGNPPWGYNFTDAQKKYLQTNYYSACGKKIESYDVFIEKSLNILSRNGQLSFVLPEALLNVKAHMPIREFIMKANSITRINYLGNAFDGVQCPCIILDILHTTKPLSTRGMTIVNKNTTSQITIERNVTPEYFNFYTSDEEYKILQTLKNTPSAEFLAGNADFALGIVTGNNSRYISTQKNSANETVLKGADLCKFHIKSPKQYLVFDPDNFQQVAPINLYRAPEKLLYRFVSNQLVFAYDNCQTLSLNSCNIVIPKIENVSIKYILGILNSSVAQFIYQKEFHSIKVLRSHIEQIPIPVVDEETQRAIISLVDILIVQTDKQQIQQTYNKLDQLIFDIYSLTSPDRKIILDAIDGGNKFFV